jgi:hypothetical protein
MKLEGKSYNPNFKIRQILATSFFIVAKEKHIFYNFVESFKKSFKTYTIGYKKEEISRKIGIVRKKAQSKNSLILCGDIKGNDKSVSLIHSTFYFQIASNFIESDQMEYFKAIICYYLRTPMLYSKGVKYSNGSTISGSWLTSSFTTVVVLIAILYSFLTIYGRLPDEDEYLIQGDDFIIVLKNKEDSFLFKEKMFEFNLRLRLDTSGLVNWYEDIEFLGFYWNYNNLPDQTDEWIISRILYPEKYIKFEGTNRIIYRTLSIILNLKRYRELYQKFKLYDKYLRILEYTSKRPTFQLIGMDNSILKITIPLMDFWRFGWRML